MARKALKNCELAVVQLGNAGFGLREINPVFDRGGTGFDWRQEFGRTFLPHVGIANTDFLKLVAESLPGTETGANAFERRNFLKYFFSPGGFGDSPFDQVSSITGFLAKIKENKVLRSDFRVFLKDFFGSEWMSYGGYATSYDLTAATDTFQVDEIYDLFDRKVENLISFINNRSCLDAIFVLKEAHGRWGTVKEFLKGADVSILEKIGKIGASPEVFRSRELAGLFKSYLATERGWADRLEYFDKVSAPLGLPMVKKEDFDAGLFEMHAKRMAEEGKYSEGSVISAIYASSEGQRDRLSWNLARNLGEEGLPEYRARISRTFSPDKRSKEERELMSKIRRRESEFSPLVSLGVAKSVGFEIEYPCAYEDMECVLKSFGFATGFPQEGCLEISPGPFWCPETASAVFDKYTEAGIIDLHKYRGLTYHFNLGVVGQGGLIPLVRAMHMTGAAFDEKIPFLHSLNIYTKGKKHGIYMEVKAFDVIREKEFKWNMKAASYLGWSVGAVQDASDWGFGWGQELFRVWTNYQDSLSRGLAPLKLGEYLTTSSNKSPEVAGIVNQLSYIFSDPGARFGELEQVGNHHDRRILPVTLDGVFWPNIAAFARDVTNDAVAKIEKVADDVEQRAIGNLKRIEAMSGIKRGMAVQKFIEDYQYSKLMEKYELTAEELYLKVRRLLLG